MDGKDIATRTAEAIVDAYAIVSNAREALGQLADLLLELGALYPVFKSGPAPQPQPAPDLFSQMGLTDEGETMRQVEDLTQVAHREVEVAHQEIGAEHQAPIKRIYRRNGVRMAEAMTVTTAGKAGKSAGLCIRNDIERSLVRSTGKTPEQVRTAVNEAADALRLTCFVNNSYRYYRLIDRKPLMEFAVSILQSA